MKLRNNFLMDGTRASGILMPIFSLPSPMGIGDIGQASFDFIDFLKKSQQQYWQILPVGPTEPVFSNSPYMSPSAFAGDPLLIDIDSLIEFGLLDRSELSTQVFSEYQVDYTVVAKEKNRLLRLAWQSFKNTTPLSVLSNFTKENQWVDDYALFKVLKEKFDNTPWTSWPVSIKKRDPQTLQKTKEEHNDTFNYFIFEQFIFFNQWKKLFAYANKNNIKLIGDVPIYVAADSVDVWVNQSIFQLHKTQLTPTSVAGVPPDYFSPIGQLWGNPLYRWRSTIQSVKNKLWKWWEERLQHNFTLTHAIRIDHFRGFEAYWSVPSAEINAVNGKWIKGPGTAFFLEMEKRLGSLPIIAEDLGIITPEVNAMRKALGYPGMKVLLFAFDGNSDNSYLPHTYNTNTVVYTGTHDNDTAVGWFLSNAIQPGNKLQAKKYANQNNYEAGSFHRDLIHLAFASVADTAIIPMQDILGFGNDCRVNTPGTTDNNWQWRCAERFITDQLADYLGTQTSLYGRAPG